VSLLQRLFIVNIALRVIREREWQDDRFCLITRRFTFILVITAKSSGRLSSLHLIGLLDVSAQLYQNEPSSFRRVHKIRILLFRPVICFYYSAERRSLGKTNWLSL